MSLTLVTDEAPEQVPLLKQILKEIDKLNLDDDSFTDGTFVVLGDTGAGHTFMVSNTGGLSGCIHMLEQAKVVAVLEGLSREQ